MDRRTFVSFVVACLFSIVAAAEAIAVPLSFGFAKVDVTPGKPLRLSGYSDRKTPYEAVDERIFVRAAALKAAGESLYVLVSIETVGFTAEFAKRVYEQIKAKHGVERSGLVLSATHTHSAPHFTKNLDNIFEPPLTQQEHADADAYEKRVANAVGQAVDEAIEDLQPGRMYFSQGKATFAVNRRIIDNRKWTGFGVQPDGPVDHSLPLLTITDESGEGVRGLIYNYACHCTTMSGNYNRVNGDWAGYSAKYLEEMFPNGVAIPTIGCGGDANPVRMPQERAVELSQAHGREIADEVKRLVKGKKNEITDSPSARYGTADLETDLPTVDELKARLGDKDVYVRRHANQMLEIIRRKGGLPESYPMPIQVWRFGNELAMVFLGGEVCVDYALRIKREIQGGDTWVTAYANDVFGYVAPEAMRSQGGYEVDTSMIYYKLPGRWASGTEDIILRRVHELHENLPSAKVGDDAR